MSTLKHYLRPFFHFFRSHLFALLAGYPAKKLQIIAVTGTDGKTTTCMMLYKLLTDHHLQVGLATTVWLAYPGEGPTRNTTKMTSLPPRKIQNFFKKCVKMEADIVIVESSSVALHQHRMAGMHPYIAAVTNITREELAYHRNMKHYEKSKRKICRGAEHVVLPLSLRHWKKSCKDMIAYDRTNIPSGTLTIPGDYNYENAAIVYEVGRLLGIKEEHILKSLQSYSGVVGRMQKIPDPYERHIYVDYAVTPAAFEAVHQSIQDQHPGAHVIHVFGATGGGRDREKRPLNGWIAAKYSDILILTDEESYGEPVEDIIADIASGIRDDSTAKVHKIHDRKEALKHALILAHPGDVILTTGMGGELTRNVSGVGEGESTTTKKMGGHDIPWEEEKILEDLAKEISPA